MRPPICAICGKELTPDEGGLVYFAMGDSDIQWQKKMKEQDMVGHPPWAEWFCGDHYPAAESHSNLGRPEAMKIIKEEYS